MSDYIVDDNLDIDLYNIEKELHKTSFKTTIIATDRATKQKSIMKIYKCEAINEKDAIDHAVNVPRSIRYLPGVVHLLGFHRSTNHRNFDHWLITQEEMLYHGSLYPVTQEYLNNKGKVGNMNPTYRSKIIFGVANTMMKIHHSKSFLKNLNIEDIYLDDQYEPHIGGFDIPRYMINDVGMNGPDLKFSIKDTYFSAPEVINGDQVNTAADVYSFGYFLYCFFTPKGELPFMKYHKERFLTSIRKEERPARTKCIPDIYWELIKECWNQNPSERPTFVEISNRLLDDKYALEEFGEKTDLEILHKYQKKMEKPSYLSENDFDD